ncbi:Uncharacterised protein [uncultured archaeon]|nr:Uncharacterised protein [uncultured archaeon]
MKRLQLSIISSVIAVTMLAFPLSSALGMDALGSILSPLKQFKQGIHLQDIQCRTGLVLVINIHEGTPACIRQSSVAKLVARGWASMIPSQQVSTGNQTEQNAQMPIITLQDNGTTIHLSKGDRFLLKLGYEYGWKLNIDNQTVVSGYHENIGYMLVRGAQGIFEAYNPGQAVLTADGTPYCLSPQYNNQASPCGTPLVHFRVDIDVS